jgi:hypothetical protein
VPGDVRQFALDQTFPEPIMRAFAEYLPEARLVPLRTIDPRLATVEDDWRILQFLSRHADEWDGQPADAAMLSQARELSVVMQTKPTLVVVQEAGHDSVKASGLLLAYLPMICKRTVRTSAQLWVVRAAERIDDPWARLKRVAANQNTTADALYQASRMSPEDLAIPADDILP